MNLKPLNHTKTKFTEQSPSWEAKRTSVGQGFSCLSVIIAGVVAVASRDVGLSDVSTVMQLHCCVAQQCQINCNCFHYNSYCCCLFKSYGSWIVSLKQNVNFKFQPLEKFIFFVYRYSSFRKSCYEIAWAPHWLVKFCTHLRSFNLRHFGMVEATGWKLLALRSPSMAWPPYWIS
jgi:hypothetical protein